MSENSQALSFKNGYRDFALIVAGLASVNVLRQFIVVPDSLIKPIDIILLVGFFVATLIAIFRAMSMQPKPKQACILLGIGVATQAIFLCLLNLVFKNQGLAASICKDLSQIGLMLWAIGLGALVASLLREKNILIPIAIFLVAYDYFLVLAPMGFTKKIMAANPNLLGQIGYAIPRVKTHADIANNTNAAIGATSAVVGPADLVFLGAFFLAMFRFNMRPKETLQIMIPTLIGYMVLVLVTGWSLPALVPIGLVTLIVNRNEFKLNKDEKISTIVLAILAVLVLSFLATRRPTSPTEPLPTAASQGNRESINSPEQAPKDQSPSSSPSDGQNKPSLP